MNKTTFVEVLIDPSSLLIPQHSARQLGAEAFSEAEPGLSLTNAISGVRLVFVQPSSARRHFSPLIRLPRAFPRAGMLRLSGGERSQGDSPCW